MQGTNNAERLIAKAKKIFKINQANYNLAYSICMEMKVVYSTEGVELNELYKRFEQKGFEQISNGELKK